MSKGLVREKKKHKGTRQEIKEALAKLGLLYLSGGPALGTVESQVDNAPDGESLVYCLRFNEDPPHELVFSGIYITITKQCAKRQSTQEPKKKS